MKTKLNTINKENWNGRKAFAFNPYSVKTGKNDWGILFEIVLCFENSKGFYRLTKNNPAYSRGLTEREATAKTRALNKTIFKLNDDEVLKIVSSTF